MANKTLRIEPVPASTMVRIAWNGGGQLPPELEGSWTNTKMAQQAITAWATKNERGEMKAEVVEREQDLPRRPGRPPKAKMEPL